MNRRQQTEAEAFLRSNEYAAARAPDFTHQPPNKVWQQGAAIPAGKSAVKTLNAIFRQIYQGNPEVLTARKTASHVQRAARPLATPVATPATPPAQAVPT